MTNMPWFLGGVPSFTLLFVFPALIVWSFLWKGLALWHAAKRDDKSWFIIFMVVHTVGIIELIYLVTQVKLFAKTKSNSKKHRRT